MKPRLRRLLRLTLVLGLAAAVLGVATLGVLYWLIAPRLPDVQALREIELQVPMTVTARDGSLVALFGETRRYPVAIGEVPDHVRQAFIAIEDARFYEHPGVDWRGVARAVWLLAVSDRDRVPGGSTITQQVARQFFLSTEYSYTRKLTEMFLALKMERELSKDEIFELYLNKSFFGNRAYGIAAAAEFYYGKTLAELELAEAAMLASIPKFPSSGNPVANPARALIRRDYVLERMHEVGFIDARQLAEAQARPNTAFPHEPPVELEAPYVAEMVRQAMVDRYGETALSDGYRVRTTLDPVAQRAANAAIREALLDYDRRHGWRGAEATVELAEGAGPERWAEALSGRRPVSGLMPALVTAVFGNRAALFLADGQTAELDIAAVSWARPYLDADSRGPAPDRVDAVLSRGDIVRLARDEEGAWSLAQLPAAQGALVSIEHATGAIRALGGGFSFSLNKFNRATQAQRQPGSSFKPFIYASAFERGFTPATIVLDAPVVFHDRTRGESWRPQNDNESFAGPMRLREAMVSSRNLVSVRVLDAIGVNYAHRYVQRFGFPAQALPENLSLALGTAALPPIDMVRGYASFANGGFLVDPWFIEQVLDRNGVVVQQARPLLACRDCGGDEAAPAAASGGDSFDLSIAGATTDEAGPALDADFVGPPERMLAPRVVDERTAFLVASLLRDVVRRGTGRGALALGRDDLGGKTGTTNEYRDAWFSGFGGDLATTAWVGMDDFTTLGRGEFASRAALPMWNTFMGAALEGVPPLRLPIPDGISTASIDPDTGLPVSAGTPGAITEFFRVEDIARMERQVADSPGEGERREAFDIF